MITRFSRSLFSCVLVVLLSTMTRSQEIADPHFDARVEKPVYVKNFPRVLFDEAHYNFDTTTGRYKPFADLLFNDGYHVAVNRQPFSKASLKTYKILVVVNPVGSDEADEDSAKSPAFTDAECDAVFDWIRDGGALLFIADATPFGSAAEILAKKLGVDMSKASTADPVNSEKESGDEGVIVYTRENQLLAEHAITKGRSNAETVNRVVAFNGQSLKGPVESDAFLKLADSAIENEAAAEKKPSAAGRAQGIAFRLGKGRVVVLGEAAMLSAQVTGSDNRPLGMNVADIDNKQLALNIVHWLSGVLK